MIILKEILGLVKLVNNFKRNIVMLKKIGIDAEIVTEPLMNGCIHMKVMVKIFWKIVIIKQMELLFPNEFFY